MRSWYEIFEHTTDAVFGIDRDRRIRFWNSACERLTGYRQSETIGRSCAGVVCGSDVRGRAICGPRCPVLEQATRHRNVMDFDMLLANRRGDKVLANVGTHYVPARLRRRDEPVMLFFALRTVDCQRLLQRMSESGCRESMDDRENPLLTSREREVLRLAADGQRGKEIGAELGIAEATVKNHFKRIHRKLGTHSRAEAIYIATQRRML